MAEIHASASESSPSSSSSSWFTPKRLLVIFCIINMLVQVDQGAIASNGVNGSLKSCTETGICTPGRGIQGDFDLNNFQDGVLSSAFIIGLVIASPTFASLAKSHNPFKLIGVGLAIWTFATAGCGSSFNFLSIAICRMLVGVGFASFISLAAPFIDDNAPGAQKTAWLAMFYMCIPTGFALGYVYGGLVGTYLNWRCAFWGEAILMLPFAVLAFVMKPLQLKGFGDGESNEDTPCHAQTEDQDGSFKLSNRASNRLDDTFKVSSRFSIFSEEMMALLQNEVYAVNIIGSIFYSFVLGAYSYWGPKAGYSMYHLTNADMIFGVITIFCGIFGTLSGGYILDHLNANTSNAFKLLSGATLLGTAFLFTSFCFRSSNSFLLLFAVGELLIFATQAPASYVSLHSVKPNLRPLSMAVSTVLVRIFGDVPSAPLVGVLRDYVGNWRTTSLINTSVLFLAAGAWLIGVFIGDPYKEDDGSETRLKEVCTEPLLDGSTNQTPISEL